MLACCWNAAGPTGALIEQISSARLLSESGSPPAFTSYVPSAEHVTYLSDVGGSWGRFCEFVDHSDGLEFDIEMDHGDRRSPNELELNLGTGWQFVFGGDAFEKGSGTLRLLEAMVRLKRRFPEAVHLLLGSRDVEMLGWSAGLQQRAFEGVSDVFPCEEDRPACEEFELRRQELAHLAGATLDAISEADVVRSFEEGLQPGGCMREYLEVAQLGILLGDTLFVNGTIIAPEAVRMLDQRALPDDDSRQAKAAGMDGSAEVGTAVPEHLPAMYSWLRSTNAWVRGEVGGLGGAHAAGRDQEPAPGEALAGPGRWIHGQRRQHNGRSRCL